MYSVAIFALELEMRSGGACSLRIIEASGKVVKSQCLWQKQSLAFSEICGFLDK
jgi:hypothetical protein